MPPCSCKKYSSLHAVLSNSSEVASKDSGDFEMIIMASPVLSISLASPTRDWFTMFKYLSIKSAAVKEPCISVRAVYPDRSAIRMARFSSIAVEHCQCKLPYNRNRKNGYLQSN